MATIFKAAKGRKPTAGHDQDANGDVEMKDKRINKQRVLMLSSRGINFRQRHLMTDLEALLPHSKKGISKRHNSIALPHSIHNDSLVTPLLIASSDAKLDAKSKLGVLNELADLNNCNNCIFFEVRKRQDLYMWLAKTPNGPSVKLHVQNIHTMDELKMTGNCLKGSRHILSFDQTFDTAPHWTLMKELFTQVFGVPRGSRRSKPFIDHVLTFSIADNRIWFRNYQVIEKELVKTAGAAGKDKDREETALVEIGPRFVMNVIRIFDGSFGGATVFENPEFVSPNMVRAAHRRDKAVKYQARNAAIAGRKMKLEESVIEEDELSTRKVFA
ncbi:Brix domain-containing protein [Jimgerdemannia flammicorona]|uniref:Brix domain-containing protein n=1 Tax=Jimgerdemannia flammicorona TaxID=994334 RepID=A0A433R069_9FUNG|nr:Brix domain-containing protein [Jimgerdemannia flammicorona]